MSIKFTTFGEIGNECSFIFANQFFTKKSGTSYHKGPVNPISYNAMDKKGSGWEFEDEDEVVVV